MAMYRSQLNNGVKVKLSLAASESAMSLLNALPCNRSSCSRCKAAPSFEAQFFCTDVQSKSHALFLNNRPHW